MTGTPFKMFRSVPRRHKVNSIDATGKNSEFIAVNE